jgi:hypothetical protein
MKILLLSEYIFILAARAAIVRMRKGRCRRVSLLSGTGVSPTYFFGSPGHKTEKSLVDT